MTSLKEARKNNNIKSFIKELETDHDGHEAATLCLRG